ncbi:hypothetical protein BRE01_37980 [Brevibacillus reuszeri]|uniref:Uncharacterized protein n=1 Tax=Brevibacillus reuszeri TaxID=54915 RepID=A0A0K9YW14_9BACL|nr:hypothetical protein [Brevibacillus reuszeri]KNB72856.1 hypothetical protein ADS79_13550 [Brevibacillus reuszeri]MED1860431.1 hypothetical protein [Brevibacillus reuszeri]GED70096.1 hypothetical protein BRE01_37980 [Brevibacillus reuszeri]
MYRLFKYKPLMDGMMYSWHEVCTSQDIDYISQLAEGMCRVDGRGRYRYKVEDITFEVMRLGNGKYKHVIIKEMMDTWRKGSSLS